jgi:hypothetical protein
MSLFRSIKFQKIRLYNPLCRWIRGMLGVGGVLVTCQGAAQFSSDVNQQLNQAIADGDFHAVSLAVSGWENPARSAPDNQKLPFIKDAIQFAAAILAKCDPSLHSSFDIGPEPPFDWQKYGIKPLFNGVSPESIEDPVAREAYKIALSDHRKLMVRVSTERQKLEEGDYCARAAFRVVESATNRKTLIEEVEKHIASIQDAQWIRERLTKIVLPRLPPIEQPMPHSDSTAPAASSLPRVTTLPLPSVQPPTPTKSPEAKPSTSPPSEEPASSTPWSIIAVLIVAAIGLLWLLVKKRK